MDRIGPYEILGELARGGMGVVLRARDPRARREVAIKVQYGTNARATRRFRTEGNVLTRLRHPNLVPVLDVGEHGGGVYLVLELVEGENLAEVLEDGPLEPRRAARITQALAEALHHVHQHGVLHRDVKPANILLTGHGIPRLTDFGLAKDLGASSESATTQEGAFLGTPGYVPPEQAVGDLSKVGPASDIYGLGATFYALLTGQPPHDGESLLDIVASMQEPLASPRKLRPELDDALADLCLSCLAKEPSERPESARALVEALEVYLRRTPRRERPSRALVAGVVTLVGLALSASLWALTWRGKVAPKADPQPGAVSAAPPAALPRAKAQERVLVLRSTGQALAKLGDTKEALAQITEACKLAPDDPTSWVMQGELLVKLGRRDEGIAAYTRALELNPEHSIALYNRGVARHEQGDLTEAISDFRQVLEQAPDSVRAWEALGLALAAHGDREEALDTYSQALRRRPRSSRLLLRRALARLDADPAGALDDLNRAIGLDPLDSGLYFQRGVVHEELGDPGAAFQDYTRAIERDPSSSSAFYNRALLHYAKKNFAGALDDYSAALKIIPTDAVILVNRGSVLRGMGKLEAAIRDFDAGIEADPQYVNGWVARALARSSLEQWEGAEADFTRALKLTPDQSQLLYNRAVARSKLGVEEGAKGDLKHALRLLPNGGRLAKKCSSMLEKLEAKPAE